MSRYTPVFPNCSIFDSLGSYLGILYWVSNVFVTPRSLGSVDYSSTRGIQVVVGLPDTTLVNRAKSPLYGELYPNTLPA